MFSAWFYYLKSVVLLYRAERRRPAAKVHRPRFRPRFDVLEDRWVPSGVTVTSTSNSSTVSGSLPWAVAQADSDTSGGAFTINFDPTVFATAQVIALTGTLNLNNTTSGESITIAGPAVGLTVKCSTSSTNFSLFTVASGTTATLDNLTISNASVSAGSGGSIYNSGQLTVSNCTFSANSTNTAGGRWSIFNFATMTVTNCTFSGNSGGSGGAIDNTGTMTVTNSTFSGNSGATGGAIYNAGTMTVTNSTFSGNSATTGVIPPIDDGGAIYNAGTMTVTNSTFSGNSAHGDGGGLYNHGPLLNMTNTIVAGNTAIEYSDICGSVTAISAYNLIGDGTGMSGISNGDANHNQVGTSSSPINSDLGSLQNNGGPTETMALLTGSPAIGTGEIVGGITTDQRGDARPTSNPDIGAYQTEPPLLVTGTSFVYSTTSSTYTVDGIQHTFNPLQYSSIQFAGTGTGTATLTDTSGKGAVTLHPNSGVMGWNGLAIPVSVTGVATIYAFGASGDIASLMDAPGGYNTFNGRPTDSFLQGNGYLNRVYGLNGTVLPKPFPQRALRRTVRTLRILKTSCVVDMWLPACTGATQGFCRLL